MPLESLPNYDLELRKTEISNPANLHNEAILNYVEIEKYCSSLKAAIEHLYALVSTGQNDSYQMLLSSVYLSLFKELTIPVTLPVMGEIRVTINNFEYVITRNTLTTYRVTVDKVKIAMAKDSTGVVIYPQIALGDTYIDLAFDQPISTDVKLMFV